MLCSKKTESQNQRTPLIFLKIRAAHFNALAKASDPLLEHGQQALLFEVAKHLAGGMGELIVGAEMPPTKRKLQFRT